jgi:hypothetical protein
MDDIIFSVGNAGKFVEYDDEFRACPKDICVIPMNINGITRANRPLTLSLDAPVHHTIRFMLEDLVVVGGSALYLYSREFKKEGLPEYVEDIQDIDFVWWPRIEIPENFTELVKATGRPFEPSDATHFRKTSVEDLTSEAVQHYGITSHSTLIQKFANMIPKHLTPLLDQIVQRGWARIETLLARHGIELKMSEDGQTMYHLVPNVTHVFPAGVVNVEYTLTFGNYSFTLFELILHDQCSSQIASRVENRLVDEIYVSGSENYASLARINQLMGHSFKFAISVPKFEKLCLQQWLVLQNRIKHYEISRKVELFPKIEKHYRRIKYIYDILFMVYKMNTMDKKLNRIVRNIFKREPDPRFVIGIQTTIFENDYWLMVCPYNRHDQCTRNMVRYQQLCEEGRVLNPRLCEAEAFVETPVIQEQPRFMPPLPTRPPATYQSPVYQYQAPVQQYQSPVQQYRQFASPRIRRRTRRLKLNKITHA